MEWSSKNVQNFEDDTTKGIIEFIPRYRDRKRVLCDVLCHAEGITIWYDGV